MSNDYTVIVENLTYYYPSRSKPALIDVSFKLREGEILAVVGPNGSGKTTLAYCLSGIIPHFITGGKLEGNIVVCGLNVREHSIRVLAQKVSLVLDDPEVQMFGLSVIECIAFGPLNLALPREEVLRRVNFALRVCRLKGLENRYPSELSDGEKQSVSIASALAMLPKVLVLDEATTTLDPVGRMRVYSIIRELAKKYSISVIFATHEIEEILPISDRVIVLNGGRIVLDSTPYRILSRLDLLESLGLKIPQVTKLYYELFKKTRNTQTPKPPLTVDEAYKIIVNSIKGIVKPQHTQQKHISKYSKCRSRVIIRVENLHYNYPNGVKALNGVNLEICEGEFIAIIGPNGSGKTTLVKHFNGLLKPCMGRVLVFGVDTRKADPTLLVKKVGYVYQNPDLMLFNPTVYEELKYSLLNIGLPSDEIDKRVKVITKMLGLERYLSELTSSLPRGIKKRVALASILVMDPDVIVVDEPTIGQDRVGSMLTMNTLKRLNREGKTVIIVSHNVELVAMYASRVIVLYNGRILKDSTPRDVFTDIELLSKASLKPPQITELFTKLGDYGLPRSVLTVSEGVNILSKLVESGGGGLF